MPVYALFKNIFKVIHFKYSNYYLKTRYFDFVQCKRLPIKQTGNFIAAVEKTSTPPLPIMD